MLIHLEFTWKHDNELGNKTAKLETSINLDLLTWKLLSPTMKCYYVSKLRVMFPTYNRCFQVTYFQVTCDNISKLFSQVNFSLNNAQLGNMINQQSKLGNTKTELEQKSLLTWKHDYLNLETS